MGMVPWNFCFSRKYQFKINAAKKSFIRRMSAHFTNEAACQSIVGLLEHMLVGANTSHVAYPSNTKELGTLKMRGNVLSGDTFA